MRMEMKEQLFWRRKCSAVAMVREVDRDEGENFNSRETEEGEGERRSGGTKTKRPKPRSGSRWCTLVVDEPGNDLVFVSSFDAD